MMTLPGITLVAFLQAWILQYPLKEVFFSNNFYVAVKDTVLITATITVITSRLEYLEYEKRELNTIIKNMDIEKEANPPKDTKKQRSYWESCERLTI